MKEILFRGKSKYQKIWVYGYLCGNDIIPADKYLAATCDGRKQRCFECFEDSIGQYIGGKGFVDKENEHFTKGKSKEVKLFDGDIVEAWSQGSKGIFVIKLRIESSPTFILYPAWQSKMAWDIHFSDIGRDKGDYYDDLRVIGNIFDNPKLINNK